MTDENIYEVLEKGCNSFIQFFSLHGTDSEHEQYLHLENKFGGTVKLTKEKIDQTLQILTSSGK